MRVFAPVIDPYSQATCRAGGASVSGLLSRNRASSSSHQYGRSNFTCRVENTILDRAIAALDGDIIIPVQHDTDSDITDNRSALDRQDSSH